MGAPGHPGPKGDAGESISAPQVIVSPNLLTVTQNQTATFHCSDDGSPKPSVSWSKISGTGLVNTGGQDNKLQIKSAGYNDSGSYVCTAANVLGELKKVVKLFVEGKMFGRKKKKICSLSNKSNRKSMFVFEAYVLVLQKKEINKSS